MIHFRLHPIVMALLVVSLLGTPVTYRGGAAAPHPHMFLQLWQDAARGSFSHNAHQLSEQSHASHGHATVADQAPLPQMYLNDAPNLTVSPFVVSDWGVPVLHAPSMQSMEREKARNPREIDRAAIPAGHPAAPEPPPPRAAAI